MRMKTSLSLQNSGDSRSGNASGKSSVSANDNNSAVQRVVPITVSEISDCLHHWRTLTEAELLLLFQQLISATEGDDVLGQRHRSEASSCIVPLSAIIADAGNNNIVLSSMSLVQCLACIRYITKGDPQNISTATDLDVLLSCRNIMRNFENDSGIQRYCCMVYRSLTFNRADNQRLVVEIGVVPLIYKAIARFSKNPKVPAAAFMCIQNITWLVEDNRNSIVLDGGLHIIMKSMLAHSKDVDVQKWGCGALQNLACCFQCTSLLVQKGSLALVLNAMSTHLQDSTVQNYGLGVLRNISYLKSNRLSVAESGAFETAITALVNYSQDADVQNSAYSFLLNTIIDVPENRKKILQFDALLPAIFRARAIFFKDQRFMDKITVLLDQLSTDGKGYNIVLEREIEPLSLFETSLRTLAPLTPEHEQIISYLSGEGMCCDPRAHTNHLYIHPTPRLSSGKDMCVLNGHCKGTTTGHLAPRKSTYGGRKATSGFTTHPFQSADVNGHAHVHNNQTTVYGSAHSSLTSLSMGTCACCKKAYLNSLVLATKNKGGQWTMHRVCGRLCNNNMVKTAYASHNGGRLATFQAAVDRPLLSA
eukprot:CFRG2650T1